MEEFQKTVGASEKAEKAKTFTVNGVSFTMVSVEGGTFMMGATPEQGDENPWDDERPAHSVTLDSYHIGQTPVAQELWKAVMGEKPFWFWGDKKPVEDITWYNCQVFIRKLNCLTGEQFRLPTEAEWEFAARGGNHSQGYKYAGGNDLEELAWYIHNAFGVGEDSPDYGTHDVTAKCPNELGIYDMSGNVWEWCNDWYDRFYYEDSPQFNPQGPTSGSHRVIRGGCWLSCPRGCRVSFRSGHSPGFRCCNLGLRLAL